MDKRQITRRQFSAATLGVGAGLLASRLASGAAPRRTIRGTETDGRPGTPPPAAQTGPNSDPVAPGSLPVLPVLGMGTWQTFDPPVLDARRTDPLREVLKRFYDAGGRVVDSSPMYGRAQKLIGRLSRELQINDELYLASKLWTRGQEEGRVQVGNSIGEMGRSKIDLMQIHNLLDWQTHLPTLIGLKQAGTIKSIGVTHYRKAAFDELESVIKTGKIDFVQLPYSINFRDAEARLLPTAMDAGVGVLVMQPFASGELFKQTAGRSLPDGVKPMAKSWAQLFLKWVIAHPAVTAVLPATSDPDHMTDNMAAASGDLPDKGTRAQWTTLLDA